MRAMGLRGKTTLIMGGTLFLTLGIATAIMLWGIFGIVSTSADRESERLVRSLSSEIGQVLDGYVNSIKIAAEMEFLRSGDRDAIERNLARLRPTLDTTIEMFFFARPDGEFVTSSIGAKGNVGDRDYFKDIFERGKPYSVSNAMVSRSTGATIVVIAAPVYGSGGDKIGLAAFTVTLDALSALIQDVSRSAGDKVDAGDKADAGDKTDAEMDINGYGWICDPNGLFITHPNKDFRMKLTFADSDAQGFSGLAELGEAILGSEIGRGTYGKNGRSIGVNWSTIRSSPGWRVAFSRPLDSVYASLNALTAVVFAMQIAAMAVMALLIVFLVKGIVLPIKDVGSQLRKIAQGHGDLSQRLSIRQKDEIGQLAGSFNDFAESLSGTIRSISDSGDKLNDIGLELSAGLDQTAATVQEIGSTIQSVRKNANRQADYAESVNKAFALIGRNADSLYSRINEQAASVNESSASIEEMVANIKSITKIVEESARHYAELLQASESGRNKISMVADRAKRVLEQSTSLQEANVVIASIASQTNLLAMNAAIEAAHAGDAGRGFSVVADEIRKLAENTQEQSRTIGDNLQEISDVIGTVANSADEAENAFSVVSEMIDTLEHLESQVKSSMDEQAMGSTQILQALGEINTITVDVRTAAQSIDQETRTAGVQMNELTKLAEEVSQSMDETSEGSIEITKSINEMAELSKRNKSAIDEIGRQTGRFSF